MRLKSMLDVDANIYFYNFQPSTPTELFTYKTQITIQPYEILEFSLEEVGADKLPTIVILETKTKERSISFIPAGKDYFLPEKAEILDFINSFFDMNKPLDESFSLFKDDEDEFEVKNFFDWFINPDSKPFSGNLKLDLNIWYNPSVYDISEKQSEN